MRSEARDIDAAKAYDCSRTAPPGSWLHLVVFQRIICGVDGSPEGFEALRQAALLRASEGRLVAVTVFDASPAAGTGLGAARLTVKRRDEAKEASEEALRIIGDLPFADARIVEGDPAPSLLAMAGRERATVLVVGTHGGGRISGILFGTVATAMLHQAPCPVLVARPAHDGRWSPRTIIVGVDGSPNSLEAAAVAAPLAARLGAEVHALAAQGGKPLDSGGLAQIDRLEWDRREPVAALVAASKKADLLVIGARGLHGMRALGSVSERVAHRAHCSVLVLRPTTEYGTAES